MKCSCPSARIPFKRRVWRSGSWEVGPVLERDDCHHVDTEPDLDVCAHYHQQNDADQSESPGLPACDGKFYEQWTTSTVDP